MAVICAKCGEELLGAVNRCWSCGAPVLSTPDAGVGPPVRRTPIRLPASAPPRPDVFAAEVVATDDNEPPDAIASASPTIAPPDAVAPTPQPNRSTFRHPAEQPTIAPRAAEYQQQGTAGAAAIASLVLGLMALGLGGFFSWAIVLGMIGVAAGICGLRSRRQTLATVGLLCCCMGTTVSGLRLAYDSFIWIHGDPPIRISPDEIPDDDTLKDESEFDLEL